VPDDVVMQCCATPDVPATSAASAASNSTLDAPPSVYQRRASMRRNAPISSSARGRSGTSSRTEGPAAEASVGGAGEAGEARSGTRPPERMVDARSDERAADARF